MEWERERELLWWRVNMLCRLAEERAECEMDREFW